MIPEMGALEETSKQILESVPRAVALGHTSPSLYGVGLIGRWALPTLRKNGVHVACCYDADPMLSGTYSDGVPVRHANDLAIDKPDFVIVTSRHAVKPVSAMLAAIGIPYVSYDAWYVAMNFSGFRRVHDEVLADERSKDVLRSILMAMLSGDTRHCGAVLEKDQYFCLPHFCGSGNETYVDAGAFVGDSVERFIWAQNGVFKKIYAFEPGPRQYLALQARTERLKAEWALDASSIELVNAALGEEDRKGQAGSVGHLTSLAIREDAGMGTRAITVLSLDHHLKGNRITLLKADVEGMETALLKGARSTIQQHRPKVAICVYHYPADIPAISSYLRDLVPEYRFSLRHHSPQMLETVLYCWTD